MSRKQKISLAWQETFKVMHEMPYLQQDIAAAEQECMKGQTLDFDEFLAREKQRVSNRLRPKGDN